jgi:hypothetical protein
METKDAGIAGVLGFKQGNAMITILIPSFKPN